MRLRIDSQAPQSEETSYQYLSKPKTNIYEPIIEDGGDYGRTEVIAIDAESTGSRTPSFRQENLGLPKEFFLVPLHQDDQPGHASVDLHLLPDDSGPELPRQLDRAKPFSGTIDIDWHNRDGPVTIAAMPDLATPISRGEQLHTKHSKQGLYPNARSPRRPYASHGREARRKVQPICFAVTSSSVTLDNGAAGLPMPSQALKRQPELLTEFQLHNYRRESRHQIRVVTRNTVGLLTTAALSGVAPQLLIASMINAYCLVQGIQDLADHRQNLKIHGLGINRKDIALAVAEGTIVRLAFMIVTVSHSDFLLFANTYADPLVHAIENIHELITDYAPVLSEVAEDFVLPAEKMQEFLGLKTVANELADVSGAGAWSHSTKELLQNILIVGAVQAGMERCAEWLFDHVGRWHKRGRKWYDIVLGRMLREPKIEVRRPWRRHGRKLIKKRRPARKRHYGAIP